MEYSFAFICISSIIANIAYTEQCSDTGQPTLTRRMGNGIPDFVQIGFLNYEGDETAFTQFGEVKKIITGFVSKRSPKGMLVSGNKKKKLETVTVMYADGSGYMKAQGYRYGRFSRCRKQKVSKATADAVKLVPFNLNKAKMVDESGVRQHWRGEEKNQVSGKTKIWNLKVEKRGNGLVPLQYKSIEIQDGVGDGFTVTSKFVYKYSQKPSQKQFDRVNNAIKSSKCNIKFF